MMIKAKQQIDGARIGIYGLTYKEYVADVRNTKVIDIIEELNDYGVEVLVHDPVAVADEVLDEFNIRLVDKEELTNLDSIVLAVPHDAFTEMRSEEHTSELQSRGHLVCRLLLAFSGLH